MVKHSPSCCGCVYSSLTALADQEQNPENPRKTGAGVRTVRFGEALSECPSQLARGVSAGGSRSKEVSFFLLPRDGDGFILSFGALASLPKEPQEVPQPAEPGR